MGMCFGVKRALNIILDIQDPENWTIIGQLVHNEQVSDSLQEKGFNTVSGIDFSEPITTSGVVITAHGCSEKLKNRLAAEGKNIIDTSCPNVLDLHDSVKKSVDSGLYPVIIGNPDHVEIRGVIDDLADYTVIRNSTDIPEFKSADAAVFCQTTSNYSEVKKIISSLEKKNPDSRFTFHNTICSATKERQNAVGIFTGIADLVLVIGGKKSSNTKKLAEIVNNSGIEAYHIQTADDIPFEVIRKFNNVKIGITAGASTPDYVIDEIIKTLETMP